MHFYQASPPPRFHMNKLRENATIAIRFDSLMTAIYIAPILPLSANVIWTRRHSHAGLRFTAANLFVVVFLGSGESSARACRRNNLFNDGLHVRLSFFLYSTTIRHRQDTDSSRISRINLYL